MIKFLIISTLCLTISGCVSSSFRTFNENITVRENPTSGSEYGFTADTSIAEYVSKIYKLVKDTESKGYYGIGYLGSHRDFLQDDFSIYKVYCNTKMVNCFNGKEVQ